MHSSVILLVLIKKKPDNIYNKKGKSETRGGCMVDVDSNKGTVVEG